jgi:hypothetical protein
MRGHLYADACARRGLYALALGVRAAVHKTRLLKRRICTADMIPCKSQAFKLLPLRAHSRLPLSSN